MGKNVWVIHKIVSSPKSLQHNTVDQRFFLHPKKCWCCKVTVVAARVVTDRTVADGRVVTIRAVAARVENTRAVAAARAVAARFVAARVVSAKVVVARVEITRVITTARVVSAKVVPARVGTARAVEDARVVSAKVVPARAVGAAPAETSFITSRNSEQPEGLQILKRNTAAQDYTNPATNIIKLFCHSTYEDLLFLCMVVVSS